MSEKKRTPYNCTSAENISMARNCVKIMEQSLVIGDRGIFDSYKRAYVHNDAAYRRKERQEFPIELEDSYYGLLERASFRN